MPYSHVADVVVVGPSCLHVHLSLARERVDHVSSTSEQDRKIRDIGKSAMEERCRNTVILAKRKNLTYEQWLKNDIGNSSHAHKN